MARKVDFDKLKTERDEIVKKFKEEEKNRQIELGLILVKYLDFFCDKEALSDFLKTDEKCAEFKMYIRTILNVKKEKVKEVKSKEKVKEVKEVKEVVKEEIKEEELIAEIIEKCTEIGCEKNKIIHTRKNGTTYIACPDWKIHKELKELKEKQAK